MINCLPASSRKFHDNSTINQEVGARCRQAVTSLRRSIKMIHRPSRDRLAETLRQYVSGQVTNDDLDEVEIDRGDRGAVAVYEMAWCLYDDNRKHKATGSHAISKEGRRQIARWIAFLYSDTEYIWPEYSFMQIINWPMNILTFGWWERMKKQKWERFVEAGDMEAWPFCSKEELQLVLDQPRLLAGKSAQQDSGGDGYRRRHA